MSAPTRDPVLDQILAAIDLADLIREDTAARGLELGLREQTEDYRGCCPFEDKPGDRSRFRIEKALGDRPPRYTCFGGKCGSSGDALSWMQDFHQLTFQEAKAALAARAGIALHPGAAAVVDPLQGERNVLRALRQATTPTGTVPDWVSPTAARGWERLVQQGSAGYLAEPAIVRRAILEAGVTDRDLEHVGLLVRTPEGTVATCPELAHPMTPLWWGERAGDGVQSCGGPEARVFGVHGPTTPVWLRGRGSASTVAWAYALEVGDALTWLGAGGDVALAAGGEPVGALWPHLRDRRGGAPCLLLPAEGESRLRGTRLLRKLLSVAPRLRVWDLAERAIPDQMPEVLPALPTAVEWLRARWVRSETPPSVAEQEKYMALLVEACPEGRERAHYSAWWAARGPVHVQTQAPSVTTADAQAPSGVSASTVSASAASVPTDAPSPPRGQWIVLDGPDGAGKTTVIQALHEALVARGVPARNLREPGGEPVAEQVRAIVRAMPPREGSPASAFLFAAARALMVDGVVKPALETGEWVLVDRGAPSTIVYQGEEGLARPMLEQLSIWAHGGVQPDVTILLTADPAVLAERVGARGDDGDARDTTSVARLTARATAYLALASSLNAIVVDTNRPVSAIVDEILAQLQARGLPLPEPLDGPSPPMVVADHAPPRARTPVA